MTTEHYEAYALEVGDQIVNRGNLYKIIDILDGEDNEYIFKIVDEEGNVSKMWSESHEKWRVAIDTLAEV